MIIQFIKAALVFFVVYFSIGVIFHIVVKKFIIHVKKTRHEEYNKSHGLNREFELNSSDFDEDFIFGTLYVWPFGILYMFGCLLQTMTERIVELSNKYIK